MDRVVLTDIVISDLWVLRCHARCRYQFRSVDVQEFHIVVKTSIHVLYALHLWRSVSVVQTVELQDIFALQQLKVHMFHMTAKVYFELKKKYTFYKSQLLLLFGFRTPCRGILCRECNVGNEWYVVFFHS